MWVASQAMNISRTAKSAKKRTGHTEQPAPRKTRIDPYPLLGIALVILLAVLTYGGLLLFLL